MKEHAIFSHESRRLEAMPLAHIPDATRRLESGKVTDQLKHTAGHELNHAIAAMHKGFDVLYLSVEPKENSLGRTIIAGELRPEDRKVVFAAGGVETHDGKARGFGHDYSVINAMQREFGGKSADQARAEASAIIGKYPDNVRERAAEIIAFLGNVSGDQIPEIIARAEWELRQENQIDENTPKIILPKIKNVWNKKVFTRIDELPKGQIRIIVIQLFVIVREYNFCTICRTENGHTEQCPIRKDTQRLKKEPEAEVLLKDDTYLL